MRPRSPLQLNVETTSEDISPARQKLYYGGLMLMIVGGVLFGSNFVIMPLTMMSETDRWDFDAHRRGMGFFALRGIGGMALMIIGGILRGIGARGWAGSGLVLDPERARQDLAPYSRMTGGMVDDALGEVDLSRVSLGQPVVKVRCRQCQALNDEHAKFCSQCGSAM